MKGTTTITLTIPPWGAHTGSTYQWSQYVLWCIKTQGFCPQNETALDHCRKAACYRHSLPLMEENVELEKSCKFCNPDRQSC